MSRPNRSFKSSASNASANSTVNSDDLLGNDFEYYDVQVMRNNIPTESTPIRRGNLPPQHDTFGSSINRRGDTFDPRRTRPIVTQSTRDESSDIASFFLNQSSGYDSSSEYFTIGNRNQNDTNVTEYMGLSGIKMKPPHSTPIRMNRHPTFDSDMSANEMPFQSTPNRGRNLPSHHTTFGSPIRANDGANYGLSSRFLERSMDVSSDLDSRIFDQSSDLENSENLLCYCNAAESTPNRIDNLPSRRQTFGSPINARNPERDIIPSSFFNEFIDTPESRNTSPRIRRMPPQSTPNASGMLPSRHATFGSPINANESPNVGVPSRYFERSATDSKIDSRFLDQSSDIQNSSSLLIDNCLCSTPNRMNSPPSRHPTFGSPINANGTPNFGVPSRYLERSATASSDIDNRFFDQSSDIQNSSSLLIDNCLCSTPNRMNSLPSRHPTFGSPINANETPNFGAPSRYFEGSATDSTEIDSIFINQSSDIQNSSSLSIDNCLCSTPNRMNSPPSRHPTFGSPIHARAPERDIIPSSFFNEFIDTLESRNTPPRMPHQSTPNTSGRLPSRHPTFGSPINSNHGPNIGIPARYLSKSAEKSSDISSNFLENSADVANSSQLQGDKTNSRINADMSSDINSSFFVNSFVPQMLGPHSPNKSKNPSIIEWFDKTVEKELNKRRAATRNLTEQLVNIESPPTGERDPIPPSEPFILDASTSRLDIEADLRQEPQTELFEAIDKLAKAEAMCVFEGAVRAAEIAAASVSPEYAEEAAAAGAQGFQAEITNVIETAISGPKLIEVVGYVGITHPRKPKKSNFTLT